jgi:hypothetical protein
MSTEEFEKLEAKLLALGGKEVLPWPAFLTDITLERGRIFDVAGRKHIAGVPNYCHHNSAVRYLHRHHFGGRGACHIATGYGLSDDLWMRHTWLWDDKRVVETTFDFSLYYGVILNDLEAARFSLHFIVDILPGGAELPPVANGRAA